MTSRSLQGGAAGCKIQGLWSLSPPPTPGAHPRSVRTRRLVAAIGPEAGCPELLHKPKGEFGQGPARRHRSSPEGGGGLVRRATAEAGTDDREQVRRPPQKAFPIAREQALVALHVRPLPVFPDVRRDGFAGHQPIRLGERRKAAGASAAGFAKEASHPERYDKALCARRIARIIPERSERPELPAVPALLRWPHLLMEALLRILLYAQGHMDDLLHAHRVTASKEEKEPKRRKGPPRGGRGPGPWPGGDLPL